MKCQNLISSLIWNTFLTFCWGFRLFYVLCSVLCTHGLKLRRYSEALFFTEKCESYTMQTWFQHERWRYFPHREVNVTWSKWLSYWNACWGKNVRCFMSNLSGSWGCWILKFTLHLIFPSMLCSISFFYVLCSGMFPLSFLVTSCYRTAAVSPTYNVNISFIWQLFILTPNIGFTCSQKLKNKKKLMMNKLASQLAKANCRSKSCGERGKHTSKLKRHAVSFFHSPSRM